jgi:hypothetical protein
MGKWGDYPDACDSNIDIFGIFINRYFAKQNNPEMKMNYEEEADCDPGLTPRMQLRMGASPVFYDSDLTNESMDIFKEILNMYDEHISDNQVVGLGISLARVLNNEQFGIGIKELPMKNLLRKDISDLIKERAETCELDCSFNDNNETTLRKNVIAFFTK